MPAVTLSPAGPFSLASGIRFLEGFSPASYHHAADGILRLAFPTDDNTSVVAATVRQEVRADGGTGAVRADFTVHPGTPHPAKAATAEAAAEQAMRAQLARILSLDVDATGFPGLAAGPVVAELMAEYPGLRPVCFHSPYEAAAWAIIGNRIRMTQAAAIKAHLAHQHGHRVHKPVATAYGLGAPTTDDVTQLAKTADRWKPYRSWIAFLLRVRAGDTSQPGPVCHGSPPPS
ncbi:DNA glycosylase family protein [Streptomyces platensis]|uniref:DNA-3-methyladenine glycosylase 2 family protein n=1 Tax=Streptomyces platensis TaxID=58346 RepID=UPI003675120F